MHEHGDRGDTPDPGGRPDAATEAFLAHRNLLFTVAYELLGSAADAEDALQETWLKWAEVDLDTVMNRRAYLVRIATRQALMRLRTLKRRKESYVGPWLPEPLLTSPDVAEDVELAESVSMAMMLVLETLAPTERAVFVLREVFDLDYDDIAAAVDKTPAAVRQIAHRARSHVADRRPRTTAAADQSREVLAAFRSAVETGDLQGLLDVLAPDVVLLTDGGGRVQAAAAPVVGVQRVAAVLQRFGALLDGTGAHSLHAAQVNGHPALILRHGDQIDSVVAIRLDHTTITGVYAVRNPEKLTRMDRSTALDR
ncbi:RNA polymerase sigma-70 factor [Glycomyces albus]